MNPLGCFDAVVRFCDGAPASQALAHAGFSESSRKHHAKGCLHGASMQRAFKQYGAALLKKIRPGTLGEEQYNETQALLTQYRTSDPERVIQAVRELAMLCRPKKAPKNTEAIEKVQTAEELESLDVRSREKALLKRAAEIRAGDLGALAKVRLRENLLNPPKHARDQHAILRTALEVDGLLGSNSSVAHFHQHSFPPAVQEMLLAKMRELAAKEQPTIDAEVVNDASA